MKIHTCYKMFRNSDPRHPHSVKARNEREAKTVMEKYYPHERVFESPKLRQPADTVDERGVLA